MKIDIDRLRALVCTDQRGGVVLLGGEAVAVGVPPSLPGPVPGTNTLNIGT